MPSSYSGCNVCPPSSAHAMQLAGPVGCAWYPHALHDGWHVQSGSRCPPASAKQPGELEPDVSVGGPVSDELLKTGEQMGEHACCILGCRARLRPQYYQTHAPRQGVRRTCGQLVCGLGVRRALVWAVHSSFAAG